MFNSAYKWAVWRGIQGRGTGAVPKRSDNSGLNVLFGTAAAGNWLKRAVQSLALRPKPLYFAAFFSSLKIAAESAAESCENRGATGAFKSYFSRATQWEGIFI